MLDRNFKTRRDRRSLRQVNRELARAEHFMLDREIAAQNIARLQQIAAEAESVAKREAAAKAASLVLEAEARRDKTMRHMSRLRVSRSLAVRSQLYETVQRFARPFADYPDIIPRKIGDMALTIFGSQYYYLPPDVEESEPAIKEYLGNTVSGLFEPITAPVTHLGPVGKTNNFVALLFNSGDLDLQTGQMYAALSGRPLEALDLPALLVRSKAHLSVTKNIPKAANDIVISELTPHMPEAVSFNPARVALLSR